MSSLQSFFFRFCLNYMKATTDWGRPVAKQRAELERHAHWLKLPEQVEVKPVAANGVAAEWLQPVGAALDQVLLYLHGGGYTMGSCNTHRAMTARIAKASRIRALLLEYRLAPEYPFPAAVEDALAAYAWLRQSGTSPQQIVIAGDSAGGGLTLATLLSLRDAGEPLPAAAICISPLTDLAGAGESLRTRAQADPWLTPEILGLTRHYMGEHDPRLPLLSPLYADLHGLPPLLIQVGQDEILLSDSTRLAEQAQAAGVEVTLEVWPDMWHVWHLFAPQLPEAQQAIHVIGAFTQQCLKAAQAREQGQTC